MGIHRVASANRQYSYDELLYVRNTYFSPEALHNANGAKSFYCASLRHCRPWSAANVPISPCKFQPLIYLIYCASFRFLDVAMARPDAASALPMHAENPVISRRGYRPANPAGTVPVHSPGSVTPFALEKAGLERPRHRVEGHSRDPGIDDAANILKVRSVASCQSGVVSKHNPSNHGIAQIARSSLPLS